jgi:SAM-dependent methyltransferase
MIGICGEFLAMTTYTNLEEYDDPEIYDLENDEFEPDGTFYLELAQKLGGTVLEIGCGTGRITIPMAQQGINITGLDLVPAMIEHAKSKAPTVTVQWIVGDVRDFSIDRRFRLIFESGATFQHMLTRADQEKMFACVREHLEPDGRFVVGTIFPQLDLLKDEDEQDWFKYNDAKGREIAVSGKQHYDPVSQIKTETAYRCWKDANGQEVVKGAPLSLRYTFPQEMEALLHYNGFEVLERYGDWDKSSVTNESDHLIYVCRALS